MWGVRAARLFDGERFVDRPTLLVDGDEVLAVGEPLPESAPVVELGEETLLPGFVDCHQHLVFDGVGTLEGQVVGVGDDELVDRARGAARRALLGGVTTLRDLGDRDFLTLGLREDPLLPTVVAAGPPITPPGGHCWYLGGQTHGEPALRRAVAERIERGCDVVKIMVTGGAMTPSFPLWENQFSRAEVQLVVDEAHRGGLPVAAHCHGNGGIELALDAGVDSIEHCSFFNDELECAPPPKLLERLAASGVAVSATWGVTAEPVRPPHWEVAVPLIRAAIGEVHRAGGLVVVGTDAGIYPQKPHDVLPHSLSTMLEAGMSTVEALRAITSRAADVCHRPDRGRLASGHAADIVAVAGDPRADAAALTAVTAVWRSGELVDR